MTNQCGLPHEWRARGDALSFLLATRFSLLASLLNIRLAINRLDQRHGFGHAFDHLRFSVPLEIVADADAQYTRQADLGKMPAEIEIAPRFALAVDGVDPFLHVADAAR